MLKVQSRLFPYISKAVHVTDVYPIVKLVPEVRSQVTVTSSPELSVAIGDSHSTNRVGLPGAVSVEICAGQN